MLSTRESVGGMHHIAISVDTDRFEGICRKLEERGIANLGPRQVTDSVYFHDPDGALIEITRHPLRS